MINRTQIMLETDDKQDPGNWKLMINRTQIRLETDDNQDLDKVGY